MGHANILLNDGSHVLLNIANGDKSAVLLNDTEVGVHPVERHATQKLYLRKLTALEFVFWLRAGIKQKIKIEIQNVKLQTFENLLSPIGLKKPPRLPLGDFRKHAIKSIKRQLYKELVFAEVYDNITNPYFLIDILRRKLKKLRKQ